MTISKIDRFQEEYRFLSNFWPATILMQGISFPTVEHAYQASKTLDPKEREAIAELPTPGKAKRAGRLLSLPFRWDEMRVAIMEGLVRQKFKHLDLRKKLLETGNARLEEGNEWGDRFWGIYHNQGENHLGKMLMTIRGECFLSAQED